MKLLLFHTMLAVLITGAAQEHNVVRVTKVDHVSTPKDAELTEEALKLSRSLPLQKPADTFVSAALDADLGHLQALFERPWGPLMGVATTEHNRDDILIAKWEGSPKDATVRNIVLWDAPQFNLTIVQCDPSVFRSTDALQSFLGRFVKIEGSPLGRLTIDLQMLKGEGQNGLLGAGWIDYAQAPAGAASGYEFDLSAYSLAGSPYFVFRTGKRLVHGIYAPGTVFVSERFPPLSERIRNLDKRELMARLGRSREEDLILLRALLDKGLSESEFQTLVSGNGLAAPQRPERVSLVIQSIIESGQIGKYEKLLRHSVESFLSMGPDGTPLLSALMSALRGIQEADFSSVAISLLRQGVATSACLSYLEFQGHTQEALAVLNQLRFTGDLEAQRERAVKAVSLRIGAPSAIK